MWSILIWIIIGGLAGWLASVLVRGGGMGVLMDVIVGIIGAFIGGLIVQLFGGTGFTGFNLWSFIVALIGAVVLLLVVRLFTGSRGRTV
ncbi:MAG TPA: GlsB/YeaQ/YmgE family stress response membrane protein [Ktedonobacterales bacterium]|nr:GlsB/YeaQ/YmgE family stress response membrane protein [Ktedonobacterales bacterium]